MIEINPFSGNVYTTTDTVKIGQDGKLFTKNGSNWIANNGDFIQKTNDGFLNLRTGVNETFGDPFGDSNED